MDIKTPRFAGSLNASEIGASAYWPDKNTVTIADLLARAASAGLNSADLNYPVHYVEDCPADFVRTLDHNGMVMKGMAMRYYTDSGYKLGAFTHPEVEVRRAAIEETKRGLNVLAEMGGRLMTLWLGQDGFEHSMQMNYDRAWNATNEAMIEVAEHNPSIDIALEYKPNEPRTFSLMPDAATTLLAIKELGHKNTGVILCFGDRNTHGSLAMRHANDRRRLDKSDRWPFVMANALGTDWDVIAERHPGRTKVYDGPVEGVHKCGLRVVLSLLESHRPIDLVIVMLGTNDLKARFGQAADEVALGGQRVARDIRRSDTGPDGQPPQVLLAAPVRVMETGYFAQIFSGAVAKSAALPACLANIANQDVLGFIDLNDVATVDPIDGIHLDQTAHAGIGLNMAHAVEKMMNWYLNEDSDACSN